MKKAFKQYPYAVIATCLGMLALGIIMFIYVGIFDIFVLIEEQGKGMFNFLTHKKNSEKNIIDYLNMASIIIAVIALCLSMVSYFSQEAKRVSNIALIISFLPLIYHFLFIAIIIILMVAVIYNMDKIQDLL